MFHTDFRLKVLHGHLKPKCFEKVSSQSQQYNYTHSKGCLSDEERQFYEENGYLVVRGLVPQDYLDACKERFKAICDGSAKVLGLTVMKDVTIAKSEFKEGEKAVTKIQDFQFDDVLFGYCLLPQVLDRVEAIVGPNVVAMHTMLINKPPDAGSLTSRHPLHQDLHYFPFRPANRVVCSWTAMENVHRSNGCLVVQPGSHRGPLLEHGYPQWAGGVNKMYHGILGLGPDAPRQHLEMAPGDTVFFHPLLIHGSGANRTEGFRKAISCHYAASECHYIDVEGTSQANLAGEVLELAYRRLGRDVNVTFEDIWKIRSRLARGEQVNL